MRHGSQSSGPSEPNLGSSISQPWTGETPVTINVNRWMGIKRASIMSHLCLPGGTGTRRATGTTMMVQKQSCQGNQKGHLNYKIALHRFACNHKQ